MFNMIEMHKVYIDIDIETVIKITIGDLESTIKLPKNINEDVFAALH